MATIRLYLSSKQQKSNGKCEIYLRMSAARNKVFRAKSNLYVLPKYWDEKKEKIMIPRIHVKEQGDLINLQKQLDALVTFILNQSIIVPIEELSKVWLERIINEFHFGKDEKESDNDELAFFDLLKLFISVRVKTGNREAQFGTLIRVLKRYEIYRGNGYSLNIHKVTDLDLIKFEEFLRIEHTFFDQDGNCIKYAKIYKTYPEMRIPKARGTNGVHYILKRLRTFYNWAVNTGRTTNNPFTKYHLPTCVYGTPFFITIEERNKLFNFDFSDDPQLAIQRDIFVFQSCIGIHSGDLYKLTDDNVVGDSIEYIPSKTVDECGKTVSVPLISQAKIILNRYADRKHKTLLPFISIQHYNKAIKTMLQKADISRIVTVINPITRKDEQHPIYEVATSYMARRNFIGNLYKEVKDANLIGSMTGHADGSKAFSRYRAIDADIKKSVISHLE